MTAESPLGRVGILEKAIDFKMGGAGVSYLTCTEESQKREAETGSVRLRTYVPKEVGES